MGCYEASFVIDRSLDRSRIDQALARHPDELELDAQLALQPLPREEVAVVLEHRRYDLVPLAQPQTPSDDVDGLGRVLRIGNLPGLRVDHPCELFTCLFKRFGRASGYAMKTSADVAAVLAKILQHRIYDWLGRGRSGSVVQIDDTRAQERDLRPNFLNAFCHARASQLVPCARPPRSSRLFVLLNCAQLASLPRGL